jgi:hypothetical protein
MFLRDIRVAITHQHYQHYDFPKSHPCSPGQLNWFQRSTQNTAFAEAVLWINFLSDLGGVHTTHHFWVYYLKMFSLRIIKLTSSGQGFLSREIRDCNILCFCNDRYTEKYKNVNEQNRNSSVWYRYETENNYPPHKGETRLPTYGSQSETTIDSCLWLGTIPGQTHRNTNIEQNIECPPQLTPWPT